jgi:hypothetical protein
MGFDVPTATWLRERQRDLIARHLFSDRVRDHGFFNGAAVARTLRGHQEERPNYGNQIYLLAGLKLWFRVFVVSPVLDSPSCRQKSCWSREPTNPQPLLAVS